MRRIVTYRPTIGETALLVLDEVASAAIGSFYPHPYYHSFCAHTRQRSLRIALKRLERKHLVGTKGRHGEGEEWYLTESGERLVRRLKLKLEQARQKRWDGKWRMAIFDIPEQVRGRRDFLRKELSNLGFHPLQKSVWVSPYPLSDLFFAVTAELGLGKHLRLVTAERIHDDGDLRLLFFPAAKPK